MSLLSSQGGIQQDSAVMETSKSDNYFSNSTTAMSLKVLASFVARCKIFFSKTWNKLKDV